MINSNELFLSGRINDVSYKTTKNEQEYATVKLVTNSYQYRNGKMESYPTFISLMVFNKKQVDYLKDVGATKSDFANVRGKLSNSKSNKGFVQLSVLVSDITIAKKTKDDEPNLDDILSLENIEEDFWWQLMTKWKKYHVLFANVVV